MANYNDIPDYIDKQDYEYILASYLGNVRDDVDKREGSIIWDAGAPCCIEIAKAYLYLQAMMLNVFAKTAEAPFLDYRCEEQGLTREPATYSRRLGVFTDGNEEPYSLLIGQQFSTISETNLVKFEVESVYSEHGVTVPGSYILRCVEPGIIGNQYYGEIIPTTELTGLATATLSDVLVPGENEEDSEHLRERYFNKVTQKAFAGNITAYREFVENIDGVGSCQIYPVWNGGGTVKISFLDSTYSKPSSLLIETVQSEVDPYYDQGEYAGKGLGMAPIGHVVTVAAPTEFVVNLDIEIELESGFSIGQVRPALEQNIQNYFLSLREAWDKADDLNHYSLVLIRAKVISEIMNTPGVLNYSKCKLNNADEDIVLTQTAITQQIPITGEIIINA